MEGIETCPVNQGRYIDRTHGIALLVIVIEPEGLSPPVTQWFYAERAAPGMASIMGKPSAVINAAR
jgi:hypothetical protein